MKALSLKKKIETLGGEAEVVVYNTTNMRGTEFSRTKLVGRLGDYDVDMIGEESNFYTIRHISKRGAYDAESDYNSGEYKFRHKLKELEEIA